MKIIYPNYGTGILKGIPIKHKDMGIDIVSFLYNENLLEEWAGSEHRHDLDYLNFVDEQEKEPVLNLRWPDQDDNDIYCYVGIFIGFSEFNIDECPFTYNDELLLKEFIKKFSFNEEDIVSLITIGTNEIEYR